MFLTFRYKLRPSRMQYARLAAICEAQRQLYNAALQERGEAWRKAERSISKIDQFKSLTQIRSFDKTYAGMPAVLSRWSVARVDDAMAGFYSRVRRGQRPGFPRYKSRSRWRAFGFDEWRSIRLNGDKLLFKGMTPLRLRLHRELPDGAEPKSCTFARHGRHWWITIAVEVASGCAHHHPDKAVGIDVGVEHLATTSDGEHFANIRSRSRRERDLRVAQRALARCKRGSRRRAKVRERLALLQRRIADARNNHLHQVSATIAKRFALIVVEDLKLKNMTRSAKGTVTEPGTNVRQKAGLNRALLDAAPGRLITLLSYKAERAGGTLIRVDPRRTSIACANCDEVIPKALSQRWHNCGCGASLHRDHNAALNILSRALNAHGRGRPPGDANVGHEPMRRLGTTLAAAA